MPSSSAAFTCTPPARCQRLGDVLLLEPFDVLLEVEAGFGQKPGSRRAFRHALDDVLGQALRQNRLALLERDRALDDVLELADVARPVVGFEQIHRLLREPVDVLAHLIAVFRQEVFRQQRNVFAALAQRRQVNRE